MRFAATHKTVSYLMVSVAFLMLVLTGEVPPLLAALSGIGLFASFFFDPQSHPFMQGRRYTILWYTALCTAMAMLLPDASRGETLWDSATHFLCIFLCARMWRRRSNADYLQAYLVSFLMLLVAALVGASVIYALSLLLYLVFATWTLTLFHLRREMEENYLLKHLPGRHGQAAESERVEVERILNSRRVVGTPFLLSTGFLSIALFFSAGLVFLLLPRLGVSLELPLHRRGLLLTGFSEQIQLGGYGVLRENPRVVMRVEAPGGPPPLGLRFRGVAFDHYQDGRWSRTQLLGVSNAVPGVSAAAAGVSTPAPGRLLAERPLAVRDGYHYLNPGLDPEGSLLWTRRIEIYLEPLDTAVLFVPGPGRPVAVALPPSWSFATPWPLLIGPDDELVVRSRLGSLHYTVFTSPVAPDPTRTSDEPPPVELAPYLQLPADLPPRVSALGQKLTAGLVHPHEQALALVRYLQSNYTYTTQLQGSTGHEPLDAFLFESKRGHCEYFASALAILLRTLGIPSRSVNGYLGGEWNEYGHYLVVRQQHAHSWVEAYLPGVGWVAYDPTPLSVLQSPSGSFLHRVRKLTDSLEMSWNKYILEYDLRTQQRLGERMHGWFRPSVGFRTQFWQTGRRVMLVAFFGLLALFTGLWLRRLYRYQRHRQKPEVRVQIESQGHLRRALLVLRRRGFVRRPAETLRQLAERVTETGDPSGPLFAELVQRYYAHRFGQQSIDPVEVNRLTREMARAPRTVATPPVS
jgi:transglutaminase-like putative cysteine protease